MIFFPICRFTGYSRGFICFCDYIHQGIYGNLWTTCSKRKVPRSHGAFWQEKNARENPACKDTRASAQGGVCPGVQLEITETFNSFNATLLHSQAAFFFPFYFFLAGKFYFENTTSFIQRHRSKIKKTFSVLMIASDPTPPLDKYFVQQIHQDLYLPLP